MTIQVGDVVRTKQSTVNGERLYALVVDVRDIMGDIFVFVKIYENETLQKFLFEFTSCWPASELETVHITLTLTDVI